MHFDAAGPILAPAPPPQCSCATRGSLCLHSPQRCASGDTKDAATGANSLNEARKIEELQKDGQLLSRVTQKKLQRLPRKRLFVLFSFKGPVCKRVFIIFRALPGGLAANREQDPYCSMLLLPIYMRTTARSLTHRRSERRTDGGWWPRL